jgi:hypothetical protein
VQHQHSSWARLTKIKPKRGRIRLHKKQPSFDPAKFEATNDDDLQHSKWRDQFKQLCEFKVQFGHCLVPTGKYSANPKLWKWISD